MPLAAWHTGTVGLTYELRLVPPGVQSFPERDLLWGIKKDEADTPGPRMYANVGIGYLNLSASFVSRGELEDGFYAALAAREAFESLRNYGSAYRVWAARHAAAYYNMAVIHWRTDRHYLDVHDVLLNARSTLSLSRDDDLRRLSYLTVAGAIERLHTGPDRAKWAARVVGPKRAVIPFPSEMARAADGGNAIAARRLAELEREMGRLDQEVSWLLFAADLGDAAASSEAEGLISNWHATRKGWWAGQPGALPYS